MPVRLQILPTHTHTLSLPLLLTHPHPPSLLLLPTAYLQPQADGRLALGNPNLERDPLAEVPQVTRSHLVRETNELHPDDETVLQGLLAELRHEVTTKRIDVYPPFKDLDRSFGFTKGVTQTQFERLLSTLNLGVSRREVQLIAAKYRNPNTGHINYRAFIADIDPGWPRRRFLEGGRC